MNRFFKRALLLLKKQHASDCQKKISFVQIMHLKITILSPGDIKSCYQQPINCKIVLFYLRLTARTLGSAKLKSQLKLLPCPQCELGYQQPIPQKHTTLIFCQASPPLNLTTVQAPFLGNYSYILVFCDPPPYKSDFL